MKKILIIIVLILTACVQAQIPLLEACKPSVSSNNSSLVTNPTWRISDMSLVNSKSFTKSNTVYTKLLGMHLSIDRTKIILVYAQNTTTNNVYLEMYNLSTASDITTMSLISTNTITIDGAFILYNGRDHSSSVSVDGKKIYIYSLVGSDNFITTVNLTSDCSLPILSTTTSNALTKPNSSAWLLATDTFISPFTGKYYVDVWGDATGTYDNYLYESSNHFDSFSLQYVKLTPSSPYGIHTGLFTIGPGDEFIIYNDDGANSNTLRQLKRVGNTLSEVEIITNYNSNYKSRVHITPDASKLYTISVESFANPNHNLEITIKHYNTNY